MAHDPRAIFAELCESRITAADRRIMDEVLDAGVKNTHDPAGIFGRLEEAFAARFGVRYTILHNSGTGTMQSCLLALGVGPGDEVIVPCLTAVSTPFVAVQCGAVPVFADIDPRTFNLDPADVARKVTEHTRAVIPVSLYGLAPDYAALSEITAPRGIPMVEDNAQCFLGTYRGRLVGTFGAAASFSFQASKHMTSGGDGGAVITDDPELARGIRKRAALGFRTLTAKPGDVFVPRDVRQDWAFERHDVMGYNFRMSAPQAALALGQLGRLEALVEARRYIASRYEEVLRRERCSWLVPPHVPAHCMHTYWAWTCVLDEQALGADWRTFRRVFIECGGDGLYASWRPVHLEPVFRDLAFYGRRDQAPNYDPRYRGAVKRYGAGDCPVCEALQPRLCPFKTSMQTLEKVERQVEALAAAIRHFG